VVTALREAHEELGLEGGRCQVGGPGGGGGGRWGPMRWSCSGVRYWVGTGQALGRQALVTRHYAGTRQAAGFGTRH